jgi:saccharopepsin
LEGIISQDVLGVASIQVTNQGFAESTKEPGLAFAVGKFDGIFGLAYDRIAVTGAVPPVYRMIEQSLLKEPLFGVYMGDTNKGNEGGSITFGSIEPSHFTGSINWAPVVRKAYWEVELQSVFLGGKKLNVQSKGAAIDTGTSLIAMPVNEAKAINTAIGAKASWNGQYTIDCSLVPSLPELVLVFAGKQYVLKGEDYILNVQNSCVSGFIGLDIGVPLWIVGDVFLRKYYTVYDLGNHRVGFALSAK